MAAGEAPQTFPDISALAEQMAAAERYKLRGEGLGTLACAVALITSSEGGRDFVRNRLTTSELGAPGRAEAWTTYYSLTKDPKDADTAWGHIDNAVTETKQVFEEQGAGEEGSIVRATMAVEAALKLVRAGDTRPESLARARRAAELFAETGVPPRHLADLYEHARDGLSFDAELKLFDDKMSDAHWSHPWTRPRKEQDARNQHEGVLCELGVVAADRGELNRAASILERLESPPYRALVLAALYGKGQRDGLPELEAYLAALGPELESRVRLLGALAKADYPGAKEKLRVNPHGPKETRLHEMIKAGVAGADDELVSFVNNNGLPVQWALGQLKEMAARGMRNRAIAMAEARYIRQGEPPMAYFIWMNKGGDLDVAMWPQVLAGAEQDKGDVIAPARALFRLAALAAYRAKGGASA